MSYPWDIFTHTRIVNLLCIPIVSATKKYLYTKSKMNDSNTPEVSIIVPLFNEAEGIAVFHESLVRVMQAAQCPYEVVYCDDGSSDNTGDVLRGICDENPNVKLIVLSRNFGKEPALAAGLAQADGEAVILIDGDGQHPVEAIPDFIAAWKNGVQVVIGERSGNDNEAMSKKISSALFYATLATITRQPVDRRATDFRLLDRAVVNEFLKLSETDRITRGLIDWLGFTRAYVPIARKKRIAGTANYSFKKLLHLAIDSLVSLSSAPLYLFCYLGLAITGVAFLLGATVFIEQILLRDPLGWKFTGTALISILILFFVGIIILSQGVASIYIATIYNQVKRRPLYIVDQAKSIGVKPANET